MLHEVSDGMTSISDKLVEHGSDESDGLCPIEGETPGESLLSKRACLERGHRSFARRDKAEGRTW
jgi:hypothetical protein